MANPEHLGILKQGVDAWNSWRKAHPDVNPDLSAAKLESANLYEAKLDFANLLYADLSHADLGNTGLFYADLRDADLEDANLKGADLRQADLSGSDLWRVNLYEAKLRDADLSGYDLSRANLSGKDMSNANLSNANLSNANLSRTMLVETNLTRANLTHCSIYGISVWNVKLEGATQDSLVITLEDEPAITVDALEVAQFIYPLLNHEKLRNVLNAVTKKGVLILGRFGGGGREVLQAIAAKLREEKYLPIIFDFERPQDHDYTETVKTLVGLARFVIVDLSGPSVPQELSHTVPFFDIPFVPIIEKGRKSYAMFVDLLKYDWVLRPLIEFASVEELLQRMPSEVIAPAEEKHRARQKLLDELFKKA